MSLDVGDSAPDPRLRALTDELGDVRHRGLSGIDLRRGRQRPLPLPLLEGLARDHAGQQQRDVSGNRVLLIQALLDETLSAYAADHSEAEAQFVRRLLEDDQGRWPGPGGAGALLDEARKDEQLTEAAFRTQQRAHFERFAAYLLSTFGQPESATQEDKESAAVLAPASGWSRRSWVVVGAGIVLVLVLLAGLGTLIAHAHGDKGKPQAGVTSPSATGAVARPSASASGTAGGVLFRFDSLGSTYSNVMSVYPGVRDTAADKQRDGTFLTGQTAPAVCVTTGRRITSDPSYSEVPKSSDQWVEVEGAPGEHDYAPLTYGELVPGGARLPGCGPVG